MPIEIKELSIRAYVDDTTKPNNYNHKVHDKTSRIDSTEVIIAACVEHVLQVLKDREER